MTRPADSLVKVQLLPLSDAKDFAMLINFLRTFFFAAKNGLFLSLIFLCTMQIAASAESDNVPANATANAYGGGWKCDIGFRNVKEDCLAIDVPENAYSTDSRYGRGWACLWGFKEEGDLCIAATTRPENASDGRHPQKSFAKK